MPCSDCVKQNYRQSCDTTQCIYKEKTPSRKARINDKQITKCLIKRSTLSRTRQWRSNSSLRSSSSEGLLLCRKRRRSRQACYDSPFGNLLPREPACWPSDRGAVQNGHGSIRDQRRHLSSMMRGHFACYGVGGNARRLRWFARRAVRIRRKWLSRRDRQSVVPSARLNEILRRRPLPPAKIAHGYAAASESLS